MRYTQTRERSAELLRSALKFMGMHDASFNPINFALWYEHSDGSNARLDAAIEARLVEEPRFSDETVVRLFQEFVAEPDEAVVGAISVRLQQTMGSLLDEASRTGKQAGVFEGQLEGLAAVLQGGDLGGVLASVRRAVAETGDMKSSAQELQRQVEESNQEIELLRRDLSRARDEAVMDSLTGILNRKGFDERLNALLAERNSTGATHCLVMLDIDHFKRVNDTHGHVVGDRVIESLGKVLLSCLTNPTHCAARYGGEEFALLLPNSSIEEGRVIASLARRRIKAMTIRDRRKESPPVSITVSLGLTCLRSGDDRFRFIGRADAALYESKNAGRDRLTFS